ncbi:MAG: aldehyde dehydrogenase, partial [bacterium]
FGGTKKSAIGPAIKAGSPHYVTQFMAFSDTSLPESGTLSHENRLLRLAAEWKMMVRWKQFGSLNTELERSVRAMRSYLFHFEQMFSQEIDYFNLRGQDNVMRYLPLGTVVIRLHEKDTLFETLARIAAIQVTGNKLIISIPRALDNDGIRFLQGREGVRLIQAAEVAFETDDELVARIPKVARIRYAGSDRVPEAVFKTAAKTGFFISCAPVLMEGSIELIHYMQNQSISHTYHRYGNLGERTLKIS